jgi:hypothetical protein
MQRQPSKKISSSSAADLIFKSAQHKRDESAHLAEFQTAAMAFDQFSKLTSCDAQDEFKKKHSAVIAFAELNAVQREVYNVFCKRLQDKHLFEQLEKLNIFATVVSSDAKVVNKISDALSNAPVPGASIIGKVVQKAGDKYLERKENFIKEASGRGMESTGGLNQVNYGQVIQMVALAFVEQCNDLLLLMEKPSDRNALIEYLIDKCINDAKVRGAWAHVNNPRSLAAAMLCSLYAIKEQAVSFAVTVGDTSKRVSLGDREAVTMDKEEVNVNLFLSNQFIRVGDQLFGKSSGQEFKLNKKISAKVYLRLLAVAREATAAEKQAIESALLAQRTVSGVEKLLKQAVEAYVPVSEKDVLQALIVRKAKEDRPFYKSLNKNVSPTDPQHINHLLTMEISRVKSVFMAQMSVAVDSVAVDRRDQLVTKNIGIISLAEELGAAGGVVVNEKSFLPVTVAAIDNLNELVLLPVAELLNLYAVYNNTLNNPRELAVVSEEALKTISRNLDMLKSAMLVKALDMATPEHKLSGSRVLSIDSERGLFSSVNKQKMLEDAFYVTTKQLNFFSGQLDLSIKDHALQRDTLLAEIKQQLSVQELARLDAALASANENSSLNEFERAYYNILKELDVRVTGDRLHQESLNKYLLLLVHASPTTVKSAADLGCALNQLKNIRSEVSAIQSRSVAQAPVSKEELQQKLNDIAKRRAESIAVCEAKSAVIADSKSVVVADSKSAVIADSKSAVVADSKSAVIADSKSAVVADSKSIISDLDAVKAEYFMQFEIVDVMLASAAEQELALSNQLIRIYGQDKYDEFSRFAFNKKYRDNPGESKDEKMDYASLRQVCQFKHELNHSRDRLMECFSKDQKPSLTIDQLKEKVDSIAKDIKRISDDHARAQVHVSAKRRETGFIAWIKRKLGWVKAHPRQSIAFAAVSIATGGVAAKVAVVHFVALGTYKIALGLAAGGASVAASAAGAKCASVAAKDLLARSLVKQQLSNHHAESLENNVDIRASQAIVEPVQATEESRAAVILTTQRIS